MPDLDAAVRAYGAILDETLIHGTTPEREAALSRVHREVLIAQHDDGGCCAFCVGSDVDQEVADDDG